MKKVFYFSAAGHSEAVARYFAKSLDAPLCRIGEEKPEALTTAVIVFPVYCQNIPGPVKAFLQKVNGENVMLIATYGRMGCGNVLAEGAALVQGRVIAGACFPTGHTYLPKDPWGDPTALAPLLERIQNPAPARIPKARKWWLADLLPGFRSRMGVKLRKTAACTGCGLCDQVCPMGTMKNGKAGKNCLRCLACVETCPADAIEAAYHPLLRFYLRKPRQADLILYL